jgi:hypothetical protein
MGGSWTSIVAAEMIAATSGVGYLILQAGNYLQTPLIFSGIITISIMGIVLASGALLCRLDGQVFDLCGTKPGVRNLVQRDVLVVQGQLSADRGHRPSSVRARRRSGLC